MAVQQPSHPDSLNAKDGKSAGFDRWLSLFYNWVTGKIAALMGADVIVGSPQPDLPNALVATDSASIDVDITVPNVITWHLVTEYAQDLVGAMFVDSASVDFTYDDATGQITAVVAAEGVQDIVGAMFVDSASIDFTYDDALGTITGTVIVAGITGFGEAVMDVVGSLVQDSVTIDITYNDAGDALTLAVITQMSVTSDASGVKLVNDELAPGNSEYYGTNAGGTKGFFALPTSSGGGDATTNDVNQTAHGFVAGNVVYLVGTVYTLADKDSAVTAEVVGIVETVTDVDNFVLLTHGFIDTLSGLTAGTVYFLGDSGVLTATEPSTVGQISKPLLIADTTTSGYFFNMRGMMVGSAGSTLTVDVFSGDASDTTFTLSVTAIHENNTLVMITGVVQQKSTYTVSGTTLTFSTAPPVGTNNIEVIIFGSVAVGVASDLDDALSETVYSGGKNAIFNGAFEVWQRGTSFAAIAGGAYSADRWLWTNSTAVAVHTVSRSTDVPTVAEAGILAPYSILIDCTTADAAVAAADQVRLDHRIEGYTWRGFAQRDLTLSFWVKATKTGTYCVGFTNSGGDRCFVAEYTVSVTDTWEKKTISITASPSAGTWDYTTGIGVRVIFALMAGTDLHTTAGVWGTVNRFATSNQVNACDSTANNFRLALVQLEVGDNATPFEHVPFVNELARCSRYYQKSFAYTTTPATAVGTVTGEEVWRQIPAGANANSWSAQWPVAFRGDPAVTLYNPSAANAQARDLNGAVDCSATASSSNAKRMRFTATGNAATAANSAISLHWSADAEL